MATVMDLLVRITGNGSSFRDDIKLDEAELDKFTEKIDGIRSKTVDLKLDDAAAQAKVDEFNGKLDRIQKQAIYLDVNDEAAKAKLDILKADLDALTKKAAKIHVDVDTRGDLQKLLALRAEMAALNEKQPNDNIPASGGNGMSLLAIGITSLIPMLGTLLPVAVGGVMGLASAFTAAGAGAVAFGAVAAPTLKNVFTQASAINKANQQYNQAVTSSQRQAALQQEEKAWQGVAAGNRGAVKALLSFENAWQQTAAKFRPAVLNAFTSGLRALSTLLKDMQPVMAASATGIAQVMQQMNQGLKSNDVRQFFQWLAKDGMSMLKDWVDSFGNGIVGIMNLMRAFSPVANQMSQGFLHMMQHFAQWTSGLKSNQAFQQFISYIQREGPIVVHTIGDLAKAIWNILYALHPIGDVMIRLVDLIARLAGGISQAHPAFTQLAFAGTAGVMAWRALPKTMTNVITTALGFRRAGANVEGFAAKFVPMGTAVRSFALGPWGILIGAVVTGVILLITHWKQVNDWCVRVFGKTIPQMLNPLVQLFERVWNGVRNAVQTAWNYIEPTLVNGLHSIERYWKSIWPELSQVFKAVWTAIKFDLAPVIAFLRLEIAAALGFIRGAWVPFWHMIGYVLKAAWDTVVGVTKVTFDIIGGLFRVVLDLLTGRWGKAWTDMKNMVSSIGRDLSSMFKNLGNDAYGFGKNFVLMLVHGIEGSVSSVINAARGIANKLKSFLGFHSPTEEGPGSEADEWAPNFMNMYIDGLKSRIPALQETLRGILAPQGLSVNGSVAAMVGSGGTVQVQVNGRIQHSGSLNLKGTSNQVNSVDQQMFGELNRRINR